MRQFDPIAESERGFLCNRFQDDWIVCRYHNLPLFPLTILLHCTQQKTTLTFIKTNVLFHLLCEKFSNHWKLLQLLLECQSSNSRILQFLKLLCVWDILIKIFISQSKCFIFPFTDALTIYFENSLLYKIVCIYFQVTISLTRFHSNSNILF